MAYKKDRKKIPSPENPFEDKKSTGDRQNLQKDTYVKPKQINHKNPKVADHIAKTLIKNNMDAMATAHDLDPQAKAQRVKTIAEMIEESETVQKALKENLAASGLDDKSRDVYVTTLWKWMLEGDKSINEPIFNLEGERDLRSENRRRDVAKDYAVTAARILGRAFIQEKPVDNRPIALQIKGWDGVVDSMTKPIKDDNVQDE